ncbi:MAG: FHA domain-containing protein [Cycloclasticus sp.]
MYKLTLFFHHKTIDTFHLDQAESTIGRTSQNTFSIDSLAVAPQHCKMSLIANECFIESLSEQFPTLVDGKPIQRQVLHQGEKVSLGKHTLLLSSSENIDFSTRLAASEGNTQTKPAGEVNPAKSGHLQIMNGADIGRVIALNKAVTELKIADTIPAIIAKRPSGYFISRMSDDTDIRIDGQPFATETKLDNNTKINIGTNKYTFFIE